MLRQRATRKYGQRTPTKLGIRVIRALLWLVLFVATIWSFGALWWDFPIPALRFPAAAGYALGAMVLFIVVRNRWRALACLAIGFIIVLAWWLTFQPSNNRVWQPDVAQTAWSEIEGDRVTLHNVRNCDYRTETSYTPRWETRTVELSRLSGIDLTITYWG